MKMQMQINPSVNIFMLVSPIFIYVFVYECTYMSNVSNIQDAHTHTVFFGVRILNSTYTVLFNTLTKRIPPREHAMIFIMI